jgi:WD40 repeat protein
VKQRPDEQRLEGPKEWVSALALSPDSKLLTAGDCRQGSVALWEVFTRRLITNLVGHTKPVWVAAFSPDGRTLATGGEDDLLRLWDVASFTPIAHLTNRFEVGSLSFSSDGKLLATAGLTFNPLLETNRLAFWDLSMQREVPLLPQARPMASKVTFAENGRLLAIATSTAGCVCGISLTSGC